MKRTFSRALWLGVVAAGCGGGGAATSGMTSKTTAGGTVLVPAPTVPRASFDVAPGELADAEIYTRIRHRVRLAREGVAYLKIDGARVDDTGSASKVETRPMYPVLAESTDRVRIVAEEDHARFAVWVMRSDTAETVLAPVQVADATGHAPATSGVWLGAGASLDADARAGASGFREVTLRSQWLRASGYVPQAALGNVWVAGEREGYEPTTADDDSKAPVPTGTTVAATPVRATADGSGAVIAEILKVAPVRVVAKASAWTEIEVHVPRVRVRGFVPTRAIIDGDKLDYHTFGHGRGYGSSEQRIAVPGGACLYDGASGEVIGVTLAPEDRYTRGGHTPGWWPVLVDTTWGLVTAYVHDTSSTADPKAVVLESCNATTKK